MNRPPQTFSPPNLFQLGMGTVVIVRYKSGGRVEAGVFLLDVYCLGVKNAFFHQFHEDELPEFFDKMFQGATPDEHSGAWGRKLVEGAEAYARRLGFAPHRDYKKGARVMGGINSKDCTDTFVFGCNGKPLFIAGPNDGDSKCDLIMRTLERKLGPQAFDYVMPMSMESEEDPDDQAR
jgi:hypothetical protein